MFGLEMVAGCAATLVGLGAAELYAHRRRLRRIPWRIHVSGTRGKSSVTRLIAAGLRGAGVPTAAKTTGTLARMILPDRRELPVFRPAGANVIEQVRIVDAAQSLGVKALVIECMALLPHLHWISENKLVRGTHGVITNARPDHLDVMGPTDADVARCLAGMIPIKGTLVTAERKHLGIFKEACEDRGTELIPVTEADVAAITDAEMAGFSYVEHKENVALALRLIETLGQDRQKALAGMHEATPDPGALTGSEVEFFGRRIVFYNAFAANDPQSTATIWKMVHDKYPEMSNTVAVFNLRADRPSRTMQLAESDFWRASRSVVLMGSGAFLFAKTAARSGFDGSRIVYAEHPRVEEVVEAILGCCGKNTLVIGMANIGGQGLSLVRYFQNRQLLSEEQ